MNKEILSLKQRIFGIEIDEPVMIDIPDSPFSLEEIMEAVEKRQEIAVISLDKQEKIQSEKKVLEEVLLVETKKEKPKFVFYEILENMYEVYFKSDIVNKPQERSLLKTRDKSNDSAYGVFLPSGITISRVPSSTLGTGVLGRAFIYQNHIEILDSLFGNAYVEVLTHEMLHIMHPQKKEVEIRQMTRNYIGTSNTVYH